MAPLEHDKKTDKNRTKRLRAWQERARKEGKLKTSWLKVKFDATKAQKLCDCLDEILYADSPVGDAEFATSG